MDTWTRQAGYPLITVTRDAKDIHAEQEIFLQNAYDEPSDKFENLGFLWYVPLTWTDQSELQFESLGPCNTHVNSKWMNKAPADFQLNTESDDDWFIVNVNQNMYYRVNYENENWEKLSNYLIPSHTDIPIRNRGALISDAFNIGKSHRGDHVNALKIIQYLRDERDYNPWLTTRDNLGFTVHMIWRTSTYGFFERYIRYLNEPIYDELGWDFKKALEDDHIDYHNRVIAVELACEYGNDDCIQNTTEQYHHWMYTGINEIREDTTTTVYCTSIRHGGHAEWDFAFNQHQMTDDDEEASELRSAMACSRASYTLQAYMDYFLNTSLATDVIGEVRDASGLGFNLAWDFVNIHFDSLYKSFGDSAYDTVWSFADTMNTEKDRNEMEAFGLRYPDMPGTAANDFYYSLKKIKSNMAWMEKNEVELRQWLEEIMSRT
uniref:Aminopeptidase N-like n=1 Tax=Saccoglossus kowalevskii TaxID=10224 RepID=A0ABM0MYN9_SACKO|nr:PREDICTED: aminopeptidase N-like [Saccoglossus kowalevskii]